MTPPTVVHEPERQRFVLRADGHESVLTYIVADSDTLDFNQTYVPRELRGRGMARELARAGLEHARAEGLKVIPSCPFVRDYISKHAEYADLLADDAAG